MTADQLKRTRKRLGMTQQELGKALGYSREHISHMEIGFSSIPPWCATSVRMLAAANGKATRDKR